MELGSRIKQARRCYLVWFLSEAESDGAKQQYEPAHTYEKPRRKSHFVSEKKVNSNVPETEFTLIYR
jgi:hypothetical protein